MSTNATAATPGARIDPIGELCFLVEITGVPIGAFAECSGLQIEMDAAEYAEGGENRYMHKFRNRMKHPNLVLKRGVTNETALLKWLLDCQEKTTRKDGLVALVLPSSNGEAKQLRTWRFKEAFPVKWQGPTLNTGSNSVATETLEIAHHGFLAEG
jgi:phage tail-like protein